MNNLGKNQRRLLVSVADFHMHAHTCTGSDLRTPKHADMYTCTPHWEAHDTQSHAEKYNNNSNRNLSCWSVRCLGYRPELGLSKCARTVPLNADRDGSVDLSQAYLAQFSEQCVQIGICCPSKSSTGRSRCPDANEQLACQLHVIISPSRWIQKIPFLPKQPPWTSQRKGSHCIQLQNVEILEI